MDTAAYLTRQGWRGVGHPLHPSGHGIKKPLLVSKKSNAFGIGKKQHDAHADQWWARAFDASLKDLNVSKDDASRKVENVVFGVGAKQLEVVGRMGWKWAANGGLYGAFVRGQGLEGTITPENADRDERIGGENVGGQKKLSKGERGEGKRGRKEETPNVVGLQALEAIPGTTATEVIDHHDVFREHQRKRSISSEDIARTADKAARKLLKEGRRKSRKNRHIEVAGHEVGTVPVKKKQRRNKDTEAG